MDRRGFVGITTLVASLVIISSLGATCDGEVYFFENFEGATLSRPVHEDIPPDNPVALAWSREAPGGWSVDRSGVPDGGVTEWRGWSFVDPIWWYQVAEGERREEFAAADQGFVIAVADSDEWDDAVHAEGRYHTVLSTPTIPIAGGNSETLSFDTSWRPRRDQVATIRAVFDNGDDVEVLRWESDDDSVNYQSYTLDRVDVDVTFPATASEVVLNFGYEGEGDFWWAIDNLEFGSFDESFEDVDLGVNVDEGRRPFDINAAWTPNPPSPWSVDRSNVAGVNDPEKGTEEWIGWSFATMDFWTSVTRDRGRSDFLNGEGVVAVAELDEWDARGRPSRDGSFDTFLSSGNFDITGAAANSLQLSFDSGWEEDGTQTGIVSVTYDAGVTNEVLRWTSDAEDANYHSNARNEHVLLELANPAGAQTMEVTFAVLEGGNDKWWAIDNVLVETDERIQIGDFNADGWLDISDINELTRQAASQNHQAAYDLTNDGRVDANDISTWMTRLANSYVGDANLDGEFDTSDFVSLFAAGTYETGDEAVWSQGDFNGDGRFDTRDLVVALAGGGYEQGPRASVAIPEPKLDARLGLFLLAFCARYLSSDPSAGHRPR